jgi:hypothetical protein
MANPEQLLFGTYVGLVLETQDPESLGRVKLIVPGKIGPLFKGWNEKLDDITFTSNVDAEVLERMLAVLPWARPSTPLWGGGTGSPVDTTTNSPTVIPTDQAITPASASTPPKTTDNRTTEQMGLDNKQGTFGNQKPAGATDCSGTGGNPLSLQQARGISKSLNDQMDSGGQKIVVNNGVMNEASFKAYAAERLKCSPLLSANIDPEEAKSYGVTDTHNPDQWANFMWKTAQAERGGKVSAAGDPDSTGDPGGSWGAFSVSQNDTSVYGGYSGKTVNDIETNPEFSANVAISMVESEVTRNNSIAGLDHSVTSRGSFAHTTMEAIAGRRGTLSTAKSGALVQRTTAMGMNAMGSSNMSRHGSPIGNFSIPAAGSKVWVIFENGNPSRPVYIGQVYEPSNIGSFSGK